MSLCNHPYNSMMKCYILSAEMKEISKIYKYFLLLIYY
ncbi:hypothetical protein NY78_4348 [Desulfovibrio sp. TomC]|nr:hypothetical protein NY78_4348 [Desulfovibrio sp. TomC]